MWPVLRISNKKPCSDSIWIWHSNTASNRYMHGYLCKNTCLVSLIIKFIIIIIIIIIIILNQNPAHLNISANVSIFYEVNCKLPIRSCRWYRSQRMRCRNKDKYYCCRNLKSWNRNFMDDFLVSGVRMHYRKLVLTHDRQRWTGALRKILVRRNRYYIFERINNNIKTSCIIHHFSVGVESTRYRSHLVAVLNFQHSCLR